VTDIKNLPSFSLRKEGVLVDVVEWIGDLDQFSELKEVWIQLEGIPSRWCDWRVFAQISSGFGLMLDVDWASLFKSLYEKVRIKIACRNPAEVPQERLFELDKKLYMITILVEGYENEQKVDNDDNHGDDDDDDQKDSEGKDNSDDDLDDIQDTMETDRHRGLGMEKPADANQNLNTKERSASLLNQYDKAGNDGQSPDYIAHFYVETGEEVQLENESEQTKRWAELMEGTEGKFKAGASLLHSMELVDEEVESEECDEEKEELPAETVEQIKVARAVESQMSTDTNLKK
jgi:hypothetical protein